MLPPSSTNKEVRIFRRDLLEEKWLLSVFNDPQQHFVSMRSLASFLLDNQFRIELHHSESHFLRCHPTLHIFHYALTASSSNLWNIYTSVQSYWDTFFFQRFGRLSNRMFGSSLPSTNNSTIRIKSLSAHCSHLICIQ